MTPGCDSREDNNLSSDAEVPTLPAKTLPLSRSRSVKRDIAGTHPIFVFYSLVDVRDGFARDCPHRHPVPAMIALRAHSGTARPRVSPWISGDFRSRRRVAGGGETRPMRGGGWCTGDRLASQVRWSGFERAVHDRPLPVVGSAQRRIPVWIPRSPGISRFKTSRVAAAEPNVTETDHDARRAWTCTGRCNVASRRWTWRKSLSPQSVGYRDGSLPPPTSWCA